VAIKVISLQQDLREGHLEVAYAEIDVLKKLKGHKNIVQLKNAIETKNNVYIVTELC
jgi:serine/threonine protein kinase